MEIDSARAHGPGRLDQHLRAGDVDARHVAEEEHGEADRARAPGEHREERVAHELRVEVEQRGRDPEDEHVGLERVLGVPRDVREDVASRDAAELGGVRTRPAPQQHDQRHHGADEDALSRPRWSTPTNARHADDELALAEPPDARDRFHLHEARDRHEDDRREHGLREVAQGARQEEGHEEQDDRRDQP